MLKKGWIAVIGCMLMLSAFPAMALTPKEQKGVKTLKSTSLEYLSPEWFTPFVFGQASESLQYWKSLLPEQDRDGRMYIVMPTLGLISPVIDVPTGSADYEKMSAGGEIDINKYLVDGVMHYPGSAQPNEEGNIVIFGHSNFYKNRGVRYPSIFADIMNLDAIASDEIWVYIREKGTAYELYKYRIEQSYETVPTDVGVLDPKGGKELTVFACTNGLAGRRIIKARQLSDQEILVPSALKARMRTLMEKYDHLPEFTQMQIRARVFQAIEKKRSLPPEGVKKKRQMRAYLFNWIEATLVQ